MISLNFSQLSETWVSMVSASLSSEALILMSSMHLIVCLGFRGIESKMTLIKVLSKVVISIPTCRVQRNVNSNRPIVLLGLCVIGKKIRNTELSVERVKKQIDD